MRNRAISLKNKIFKRERNYKDDKNGYELILSDFIKIFDKKVDITRHSLRSLESNLLVGYFVDSEKQGYLEHARSIFDKKMNKFFAVLKRQNVGKDVFERLARDMFSLSQEKDAKMSKKDPASIKNYDVIYKKFILDCFDMINKARQESENEEEAEPAQRSNYNLAWDEIEHFFSITKYFEYREKMFEKNASWTKTLEEEKQESLEDLQEKSDSCEKKILAISLTKEEFLKLKISLVKMIKVMEFGGEFGSFLSMSNLLEAKETYEILNNKAGFLAKMFKSAASKQNNALALSWVAKKFVTKNANNDLFLDFPSSNGPNIPKTANEENYYSFGQEIAEKIIRFYGADLGALCKFTQQRSLDR